MTPAADLSITKTDTADPVVAGQDLTYTLVVPNDGPSDATNVVVTDDVPAGTSFVRADSGGIEAGGTVTWNLGTVADGGDRDRARHRARERGPHRGPVQHRRASARDLADLDPGEQRRHRGDRRGRRPPTCRITKTDDADPVVAGRTSPTRSSSRTTVRRDATNVVVTDDVPAGTTFVCADNGGLESGGTVTWNLGDTGRRRHRDPARDRPRGRRSHGRPVEHRERTDPTDRPDAADDCGDRDHGRRRGGGPRGSPRPTTADPVVGRRRSDLHPDRDERRALGRRRTSSSTEALPAGTSFVSADGGGLPRPPAPSPGTSGRWPTAPRPRCTSPCTCTPIARRRCPNDRERVLGRADPDPSTTTATRAHRRGPGLRRPVDHQDRRRPTRSWPVRISPTRSSWRTTGRPTPRTSS